MSPERAKQFELARQRKLQQGKKPQQYLLSKDGKTKYLVSRNFPETKKGAKK